MERNSTPAADIPKWSALLVEAVNKPGLIMDAYSAFHSYSIGNQILAMIQCQLRGLEPGPINTFPDGRYLVATSNAASAPYCFACPSRANAATKNQTTTTTKQTAHPLTPRLFISRAGLLPRKPAVRNSPPPGCPSGTQNARLRLSTLSRSHSPRQTATVRDTLDYVVDNIIEHIPDSYVALSSSSQRS